MWSATKKKTVVSLTLRAWLWVSLVETTVITKASRSSSVLSRGEDSARGEERELVKCSPNSKVLSTFIHQRFLKFGGVSRSTRAKYRREFRRRHRRWVGVARGGARRNSSEFSRTSFDPCRYLPFGGLDEPQSRFQLDSFLPFGGIEESEVVVTDQSRFQLDFFLPFGGRGHDTATFAPVADSVAVPIVDDVTSVAVLPTARTIARPGPDLGSSYCYICMGSPASHHSTASVRGPFGSYRHQPIMATPGGSSRTTSLERTPSVSFPTDARSGPQ